MLVASGLAAIQQTFFLSDERLLTRYVEYSPWLAFASVTVLFCFSSWHLWHTKDSSRFADALFAFAITVAVASLIPGRSLIEADAAHMVATSQGILGTGTALAPSAGVYTLQGELLVTQWNLDKRGVMFPLGLAALHSVLGFDADHALTLNLFCGFGALFFLIRFARRFATPWVATSTAFFAASIPLVSVHIRSGTFDVANLFFLLFLVHSALSFFSRPTRTSFWIMSAAASVVSQLRYESIAPAAALVVSALFWIAMSNRLLTLRKPTIWISPWLFMGAGLRRAFPFADDLPTGLEAAWSLENFWVNIKALALYLSRLDGATTSGNIVVFGMAAIGCALLFLRLSRSGSLAFVSAVICTLTIIQLFFFWSNPLLAQTVRYFLPLMILIALFAAVALGKMAKRFRLRWSVLAVPLFSFIWSIRPASEAREFEALTYSANTSAIDAKLTQTDVQCKSIFFTHSALPLLVRGFSVMPAKQINEFNVSEFSRLTGYRISVVELPNLYVTLPANVELPIAAPAKCPRYPARLRFIKH